MEQIQLNAQQIKNTLKYIDATQSDEVRQSIFGELGHQCFHATGTEVWLEKFRGKPDEYLKRVNDNHAVMYWDNILPGADGRSYTLTGVVVDRCVCSFADGDDTPVSLCDYCCKRFQQHLFGTLFDRDVDIEITHSYLKGDDRCSTVIHFV